MVRHMENYSASLDGAFHALSDPTRRAVMARLMHGPAPVKELAAPFQIGLPTFLKHLKILEDNGLITTSKEGRVRTCHAHEDRLEAVRRWLDEQRAVWESRFSNLDNLLVSLSGENDEA
jgi:DNA-binding transcriptional ArsR family regulator